MGYLGMTMFMIAGYCLVSFGVFMMYLYHMDQKKLNRFINYQHNLKRRKLINDKQFDESMREYSRRADEMNKYYKGLRKSLWTCLLIAVICLGMFIMLGVIFNV